MNTAAVDLLSYVLLLSCVEVTPLSLVGWLVLVVVIAGIDGERGESESLNETSRTDRVLLVS